MASAKRPRLSAEQTRERLTIAGVELLADNGLSVGMDAITLEQAVRTADVSRSSAYAAWSTDDDYSPQDLFQRTVLRRAVEDRHQTIDALQVTVAKVLEDHAETMTGHQLLREMIRVGGANNSTEVSASMSWQIVSALRSILHSTSGRDDHDEEFAEWMDVSEQTLRQETIDGVYRPMVELTGIMPRPEYGELAYEYGEIASAALAEGLSVRRTMSAHEHLIGVHHPKDPDREWSLYSLMFERIVHTFFLPPGGGEWDDWE